MSPLAHSFLKDLILLNRLSLTGAKAVHGLLMGGLAPSEILRQIREENFLNKKAALMELSGNFEPEKEIETAEKNGIYFLTILDSAYPQRLSSIADPPLVLYVQGTLTETDRSAVAIVGTRHPSFYGREQAQKFSGELSQKGFTVVSGLAHGIDQMAHGAALNISYGRTLAVLGCGLDVDYPLGSKKIREAIVAHGAVMSEYAFGTPPRPENFPRRNRIIAGLSLGTLVIEAHSKSGSLITAHLAAEEGREVFAVPGSVEQLGSRGTHHLIKEGAHLVECAQDVIQILAPLVKFDSGKPAFSPAVPISLDSPAILTGNSSEEFLSSETEVHSTEEEALIRILSEKSLSSDEISDRLSASPEQLSSTLTFLELKGKILREYDGRFALAAGR